MSNLYLGAIIVAGFLISVMGAVIIHNRVRDRSLQRTLASLLVGVTLAFVVWGVLLFVGYSFLQALLWGVATGIGGAGLEYLVFILVDRYG